MWPGRTATGMHEINFVLRKVKRPGTEIPGRGEASPSPRFVSSFPWLTEHSSTVLQEISRTALHLDRTDRDICWTCTDSWPTKALLTLRHTLHRHHGFAVIQD